MSIRDEEEETRRIRRLLNFYYKDFVKDLYVSHVMPELLQKLILTYEDKQLIDNRITSQSKAEKLLEVLLEKSERNVKVLPAFKSSVERQYKWLHDKLTEDVPDHEIVEMTPNIRANSNGHEYKTKGSGELGWIQSLPPINIKRTALAESVMSKIAVLKASHYLAVHGMAGSGKTVLVTQVIRDMVKTHRISDDEVYWLSIGKDCGDSNDVLVEKMRILCDKLSIPRAPESVDHGKEILKDALVRRGNMVLILDNVWSSKVIKAFDVGFRTVVTTRDAAILDVVNGRLSYSVSIKEGFTEEESLKFFSEALKVEDVNDLPSYARKIHAECKGSPMVISLIASLLNDHQAEGVEAIDRWEYYYDSLAKRKYSSLRRDRTYEYASISDAISLSFESLSEKEKSFYQDLAIFQYDVSVPCEVLETLWSVSKCKVEDIMDNFVRKSLAVKERDGGSYKYSIHDLQLDYLKTRLILEPGGEQALHKKLIEKYEEKCHSKFHKLPNDGYFHFHVGYHLYKAGRPDLFPPIYLNLNFLGEKLKITGPADVLLDFRKYKKFITNENVKDELLLNELEELTNQVGYRLYGHTDIDIVQVAVQSTLPNVSSLAKETALQLTSRVYLDWKNAESCQGKSPVATVPCGDYVRCAQFVGCKGNLFIAGLSNGEIKLCDLDSLKVHCVFRGHTEPVNTLSVYCSDSPFKKHKLKASVHMFASGSDDEKCKLWDLAPLIDGIELEDDDDAEMSPSPKIRNRPFSFSGNYELRTFQFHSAPVTAIHFSSHGEQLVSTSANEILIWKSSSGSVLQKITTAEEKSCQQVLFPPGSSDYLLGVNVNQITVMSASRPALRSQVPGHHMKIVQLFFRNHESFCTVSENEVGLWSISIGPIPDKRTKPPVTPSISVPLTNGSGSSSVVHQNSLPSPENLLASHDGFLHPTGVASKRGSRTPSDCGVSYVLRSGRTSPFGAADGYSSNVGAKTFIDTPNGRIQVSIEKVITKRSRGFFTCAAIDHKCGDLLACGTWDQKIVLLQLDKFQYLGEFASHYGSVTSLCFSPVDEYTLLSGSADQTVKVWDLADEEKEKTEPQKTCVFAGVAVIDGGYFVSVCATERKTIMVHKDAEVLGETVPLGQSISALGLLKNGSHGAGGTVGGQVLWLKDILNKSGDLSTVVIGNHDGEILWIEFGSYDNILATGSYDRVLIFKDFQPQRVLRSDLFKVVSFHFCFQDTALAVCNEDGHVNIQRVGEKYSGDWTAEIRISCSLMEDTRSRLFVGSEEDGIHILQLDEELKVKSCETLDCKHQSPIRSLALCANGERLAVGHENGLITVWNITKHPYTEEVDLILHKSRVRHLSFPSSQAPWLLSCGDQLALWTLDKPIDKIRKKTFMEVRRRRKSGDNNKADNRLSLEIPAEQKIGRQGKRELLQTFMFRGNYAENVVTNPGFSKFLTVDNFGVFYVLEILTPQTGC